MTRFSPDSDILDSMIHAVYRYKTGEVDNEGQAIYRPIAFQTDTEDITLIYDDFSLTQFDISDEVAAKAAFANVVRNFDSNIAEDISAGTMDLFQLLQRVVDALHVSANLVADKYQIPTKVSQLANDAGYISTGGTVEYAARATADADGNEIKTTYAKKSEMPTKTSDLNNDSGYITGVAWDDVTDKPVEFPVEAHEHSTKEITKLVGYSIQTAGAISASDTLNKALGKLQASVDTKLDGENGIAPKASADAAGNNIINTYATKTQIPANVGSSHTFVYTNNNGVLTATDFEIWVSN